MGMAHDVEPLVGARLAVAVEQLAHAVDENLGAAAGNAVESGGDQPIDHVAHRQSRHAREVDDLGRRQRVQLELGIALLDRAEEIFVPLQRQVGVVAALQQQLHAADRDGLVDLAEDLVEAEDIAAGIADGPVERAEVAARDADVRVVDVSIDDVGDDACRMLAGANVVGHAGQPIGRRLAIEKQRLVRRDAAARLDALLQRLERHPVAVFAILRGAGTQ